MALERSVYTAVIVFHFAGLKMDKMSQEDTSLRRERDLTLASPVKRPRTHCIETNEYSVESIFDFPELLTFPNITKFPSSKSILKKNLIVVRTAASDDMEENFFLQLQDIKLILTPRRSTSVTDDADMLLSKVCVITAERHLVHLGTDPLTSSDKLLSYLPNEAGKALVESHISSDVSSPCDAFWLGKSLDDKALVLTPNCKDWRRVQHGVTQMQAFTLTCDEETKGQVNGKSMRENTLRCPADVSVCPHDVVLGRNTATENVSFEIDDLYRVNGEYAAGKMKARNEMANRTTEAPESERMGQEPAEEHKNVGLYGVIDPAIWNESDSEERHCNSASTAGVQLSPSVKVCDMQMPPPLCFDVRTSQEVSAPDQIWQFYHQSITLQCKDEKEDLCQSYTEPRAASITSSETYNMTGNQSSSPHSPTRLPPAGDGRQETHNVVELQLKEQHQFDSIPNSLDNMRTQQEEQSQAEISRIDWIAMINERKDLASLGEMQTDPHVNLEKVVESEEELLQRNELQKQDTAYRQLKCVEDRLEEKFELCVDHRYHAHMSKILETTVGRKKKQVKDVEEGLKTSESSEEDVQQQNEHNTDRTEVSHVKSVAKQTDSNMHDNRFTLVSPHKQENKLSISPDYQHRVETHLPENTHELVAFAPPPTRDAVVVPCQSQPSPSLNANSPTTLSRSGRFSPVASACVRYNWRPGGFDIFKKIQLSPDDYGDNDAGLTSSPGRLLTSPERQPSHAMQEPESNGYHQAPEEEERDEEEELQEDCHAEYMANGFLNSDASFNDPRFISATDVIAPGWPEQQPHCESTFDSFESIKVDSNTKSTATGSTEGGGSASDTNECPGFEMKKQFNVVLKELNLFFDISKSELWPKQCHDIREPLKTDSSDSKNTGCHKSTSTGNCQTLSTHLESSVKSTFRFSTHCISTHQLYCKKIINSDQIV